MEHDIETRLRTPEKYDRNTDLIANITGERASKYSIFSTDFLTKMEVKEIRVYQQNTQLTQDFDEINQNKHWMRLEARENRKTSVSRPARFPRVQSRQKLPYVKITHAPADGPMPVEYVRGQKRYRLCPVLNAIK